MVAKNLDIKISLLLGLICVFSANLAEARPLPKECKVSSKTPYRIRGKVVKVTTKQSYVSFKVRVRSKVNLCTGQEVKASQKKVETVSFGGKAHFKDRSGMIRTPASLQMEDTIVATGTYGPLVFPADCTSSKGCYDRGIVLYQPSHRLVRR